MSSTTRKKFSDVTHFHMPALIPVLLLTVLTLFISSNPASANHPLENSIVHIPSGTSVSRAELMRAISEADIALLGEKHDNAHHHSLRLDLLKDLAAQQILGQVSLEMLTDSQQPSIDELTQRNQMVSDEELKSLLQWDDGWQWDFYAPVLRLLLDQNISMQTANLDRSEIMTVMRTNDLHITGLGDAQLERLYREIDDSHCGLLPESQFPAMVRVQQARDQRMADSLRVGPTNTLRVLLAGNFHVRHDVGVSNYLDSTSNVISVAFLEIEPAHNDVSDYIDAVPGYAWYDYVWFTARGEEIDYCARMRQSMRSGN